MWIVWTLWFQYTTTRSFQFWSWPSPASQQVGQLQVLKSTKSRNKPGPPSCWQTLAPLVTSHISKHLKTSLPPTKSTKKNSSTPSKIINHLAEFLQSFPNFWKVRPSWESSPHPIPITRSHRLHPHEFQLFADVLRQLVDFALLQREVMALVIYRSYGNRPSFF